MSGCEDFGVGGAEGCNRLRQFVSRKKRRHTQRSTCMLLKISVISHRPSLHSPSGTPRVRQPQRAMYAMPVAGLTV